MKKRIPDKCYLCIYRTTNICEYYSRTVTRYGRTSTAIFYCCEGETESCPERKEVGGLTKLILNVFKQRREN